MKPTVGRIVIYTNLGDVEQHAALVTSAKLRPSEPPEPPAPDSEGWIDYSAEKERDAAEKERDADEHCYDVTLAVFYRTGLFFMTEPVPYSSLGSARGHWHWPERA